MKIIHNKIQQQFKAQGSHLTHPVARTHTHTHTVYIVCMHACVCVPSAGCHNKSKVNKVFN